MRADDEQAHRWLSVVNSGPLKAFRDGRRPALEIGIRAFIIIAMAVELCAGYSSRVSPPEPSELPGRGALRMVWENLLFAHWPVPPDQVRPLLPKGVELDTFDGCAWIGVVPFFMREVGCSFLPGWAGRDFPELNVRTYVRANGRGGVWFFSLDAASRSAVRLARSLFFLPYFDAEITGERVEGGLRYRSRRVHAGAPPATLEVLYAAEGPPERAAPGSLLHFLVERYRLFAKDRQGRIYRCEISHAPWPLQKASAELAVNSMAASLGFDLAGPPPLVHFAGRVDVFAGWRRRVG